MAVRDSLSGRVLGEFVLRERIGEGGFGAVYRCEQPLLGREAVIKVLHTSLRGSEVVLQRFTREAQLASRLDHPYAAHIYAFGVEKEDGLCWIAMELVQGTTLDRWLRDRGPLPLAQLVPFFERVAEVVQTAHEAGIVHRDLKPSNIMVIERAGRLLPKLLDFGIAKMVAGQAQPKPRTRTKPISVAGDAATALPANEGARSETPPAEPPPPDPAPPVATPSASTATEPLIEVPRLKPSEVATLPPDLSAPSSQSGGASGSGAQLTKADATIGSPPYMSPEQWQDATRVGPRSDLYALGIVAYEALLGRRPFAATSLTALANMHCNEPVPSVGDSFPPTIDRFFQRALAKLPEDRPATALELAATLRVAAGIGSAPEDLPRLEEGIRDAWLAEAPQNLAEGVAQLDGARNVHQARDAARDLFRGLVRYLVAIALAARAQIRSEHDDASVRDLLRGLRGRDLDEDERIKLLRLLVRPFAERRGAYPVPELVDFVGRADEPDTAIDRMLELRPSTDHGGTEDIVRSQLVQFLPALAKVMRAAAFVLAYPLVIPQGGTAERWMGMRRQRRSVAVVRDGALAADLAVLLDREGRRALVLSPLVQAIAPTAAADRESFVFDGRGRLGARLTAAPAGFEHHDPAVWDWFAENVLGEIEGEAAQREDERPPYLGLATFAAADADRFVGREREIDTFINRLRRQPLQVVVGPSGAGKSSFVHAGVVPGLPAGWRAITLRPGMTPLTSLALRLAAAGVSTTDLRPLLESAPAAAATLVAHAAGDGAIVIVVDQLEEVFTLCPSAEERDKFATALAHLAAAADGATRVICTVRDDFLMHVESLGPLRAALSSSLFLIGNPSRDDLVRTIVEPARRIGYELSDPELAGEMVAVVADRPGALALLSFTASRLWELRDRRFKQLTRKAYEGMGGVAGALGQHAETTFLSLVPDEQRVAREAFRFLVTADMTRAVLRRDELRQRLASPRADAVLAKLVDARLLAVVEGDAESQIEIIHEALIRAWPRLQDWTREDTADARSREQIRTAAKQWADRDRPRELLWRGDLLRELARWRTRVTLSDLEAQFADASQADALRGTRIRRAIVAVAMAITAVFIVVLARAKSEAQGAQREAETLLRDSTFDQGRLRMLQGDKLGALPFLAKAYGMGETGDGNRLMIEEALRPTRARVGVLAGHADKIWQVDYSRDGKLLATASLDGTARVWDAEKRVELDVIKLAGQVRTVAFSPDGKLLAIGGFDPNVRVWDVQARREVARIPVTSRVSTVLFSPDGKQLVIAGVRLFRVTTLTGDVVKDFGDFAQEVGVELSADGGRWLACSLEGRVLFLDGRTLAVVRELDIDDGLTVCSISPDGHHAAVGTQTGELRLVRDDGAQIVRPSVTGGAVLTVAFSPDGKTIATAGADRTATLWDAEGTARATLAGHRAWVHALAFAPDGSRLATMSADGTIRLWAIDTGALLGELTGTSSEAFALAIRPDGRQLVSGAPGSRAFLWDVAAAQELTALPTAAVNPSDSATTVSYAPDGAAIGMVTRDGSVAVWAAGKLVCTIVGERRIGKFAWSPDGRQIATLWEQGSDGVAQVYAIPGCQLARSVGHGGPSFALRFSSAGELVVGSGTAIEVWDLATGQRTATFPDLPGLPVALEQATQDRIVAVTYQNGAPSAVVVLSRSDGIRSVYRASQNALSGAALDEARHHLLASSFDHKVWVWDTRTGEVVAKLDGSGPVFAVRVSPDGARLVAVGGYSPTIWDAATLAPLGALPTMSGRVVAGDYISDRIFVTASEDGIARVWDLSSRQQLLELHGALAVATNAARSSMTLADEHSTRLWSPRPTAPDTTELAHWQ